MSSEGDMKISHGEMTLLCRKCLSSFNSRKVRLASTALLNGFKIFLMATSWLVRTSLAELGRLCGVAWGSIRAYVRVRRSADQVDAVPVGLPHQTERAHAHRLQVGATEEINNAW